jgi:hypothetical protein
MQQKAFSRLDDSSMVDPHSKILVDSKTSNKENRHSIRRRDTDQLLKQCDVEAKLLDLRNADKAKYADLKAKVKRVANEVKTLKTASAVPGQLKSQLQETVSEALANFKLSFIQDKKAELVELVTREIAKHIGSGDSQKSSKLKQEYEEKVRINQDYIDRLKRQNHTLKSQVEERREPSLDKYRALVSENLRLKEELTSLKHKLQSCGKCRGRRDLLGDD